MTPTASMLDVWRESFPDEQLWAVEGEGLDLHYHLAFIRVGDWWLLDLKGFGRAGFVLDDCFYRFRSYPARHRYREKPTGCGRLARHLSVRTTTNESRYFQVLAQRPRRELAQYT